MKAAIYTKGESGKSLHILDVPNPVPKDDEVLIKVCAASVNPLDWRLKSNRPGVDVAGRVEAVGRAVLRFKPGDEVFGVARGAFAEFACAPESKLVLKRAALTFVQAAAIPVAGLTALQALRDIGHLKSGQKILINGAAGGVGTFSVQIARSMGAHVTAVCSTRNVEQSRALGANRVIDYTRDDFLTDDQHYDLLLDNVGNRPLSAMKRVLAPRGRCVMVGAPKTMGAVLARILEGTLRPRFTFFVAKIKKEDLEFLCDLIQTGKVISVIDNCFPLTDAAGALACVENGHARGKVVINLQS
jgi:NADPH:quinone reductase-like Zn-dependent oxidoreductase